MKPINNRIQFKEFITEKEYAEINGLVNICKLKDGTNQKLELDYKLYVGTNSDKVSYKINEYLYYIDDELIAYLGISSFGANIAELNGLTHPNFRRKGFFSKLLELAVQECQARKYSKILLLSDRKSGSGIDFIKSVGGEYNFSEYRMRLENSILSEDSYPITLRKELSIKEDSPNDITYMVELEGAIIGKIKAEYSNNSAFISGFGILPEYRGFGYGKAALKEVLRSIIAKSIYDVELDVECKNNKALNLYKVCGFEEKSIMDYYGVKHKKIIDNNL